MYIWIVRKILKQLKRDPLLLILILFLAPFFVILYKLIFLEGMTIYNIIIFEGQPAVPGIETTLPRGEDMTSRFSSRMEETTYPGGGELFHFSKTETYQEGITRLENHDAHCMLIFPPAMNDLFDQGITILGDFSNPYFLIASQLIANNLKDYFTSLGFGDRPFPIHHQALGISFEKTEFENYIPGLIIFAALALLYLYGLILMKEIESNVFYRYRIARVPASLYIGAHSLVFTLLCIGAVLLTFLTAFLLGFHSAVSITHDIGMGLLICVILNLSTIGTALIMVALSKNTIQCFLASTFPFMLYVFFSGSVYPFPKIILFQGNTWSIGLFDFLPAAHAVSALNKILTFGTSPLQLWYELTGLLLLSFLLYGAGSFLFSRKKLKSLEMK